MTEQQMKTLNSQEDLAMLKNLVFTSIISADNDKYTEEVKQMVIRRYDICKKSGFMDWAYIFQPLGDDAEKYIELFRGA